MSNDPPFRFWSGELRFEVAPQMRQARLGDLGTALGLGENKGALQHGLREQCETPALHAASGVRASRASAAILRDGIRMRADMRLACCTKRRMRGVGFLHHRAEQAGEFRQAPASSALRKST